MGKQVDFGIFVSVYVCLSVCVCVCVCDPSNQQHKTNPNRTVMIQTTPNRTQPSPTFLFKNLLGLILKCKTVSLE